ncbi:hypothetical protein ACVWZJ_000391 [Thermostichus sp. OS-CIW-29]
MEVWWRGSGKRQGSPILGTVGLLTYRFSLADRAVVTDFNTGIPSVRRLQKVIKDRETLEVKLNTGDVFVGQLRWQDPDCLCLADAEGRESLLWRSAIAFIKVRPQS